MKFLASIFVFCLILASQSEASGQSYAEYSERVRDANVQMESSVTRALERVNLLQRGFDFTRNAGRWAANQVRRLPFVPWQARYEPYGELRKSFYSAASLMFEISVSTELSDSEKDELIDQIAVAFGNALERYHEPYVDPFDAQILEWPSQIENPFWRLIALIPSRVGWLTVSLIPRDLYASLMPLEVDSSGVEPHVRPIVPRSLPVLGRDAVRSSQSAKIAKDLRNAFHEIWSGYKSASKEERRQRKNEAIKALKHLMHELKETEPIRHGELHSLARVAYMTALIWFFLNPRPELWYEPTIWGPAVSAVMYVVGWATLIKLRSLNSGNAFYRQIQFLRHPELGWLGRRRLSFINTLRLVRLLWSTDCTSRLGIIPQEEYRFSR